jgi:hypothetical protein
MNGIKKITKEQANMNSYYDEDFEIEPGYGEIVEFEFSQKAGDFGITRWKQNMINGYPNKSEFFVWNRYRITLLS